MVADDPALDAVKGSERTVDGVYVRSIVTPGVLASTFIRLVPGGATPANTFEAECTVDVDGDGNVIGVTVHQYDLTEPRKW